MAVVTGQVSGTNTSVLLCQMPPGPCALTIVNAGTVTAYVGAGTVVTTTNGCPVPSGAVVPFTGFQGGGSPLQMITAGGTATLGFIVSSAPGSTGL